MNRQERIRNFYEGKAVWITGASSGIGRALVTLCHRAGARCVASARREDELRRLAAELGDSGRGEVAVLPLDLARTETLAGAAEQAEALTGGIDVLINNAGVSQRGLALDTPVEIDRQILETNTLGPIALTKAIAPRMIARGGGHIGVVSSVLGHLGGCRRSAYAASKHALHGFFESLRAETHAQGLRITIVCPGYVRTDVSRNALLPDGSAYATPDPGQEGGMTPEACAQGILDAIARGRAEAYVGGKEIGGIYLMRWMPGLLRRILRSRDIS